MMSFLEKMEKAATLKVLPVELSCSPWTKQQGLPKRIHDF